MPQDDFIALESKLRQSLMPVALSESATHEIHAIIDELAAVEARPEMAGKLDGKPWSPRWHAAAAAVAALLAVAAWLASPGSETISLSPKFDHTNPPETFDHTMQLVDESTHLAWFEDEGWIEDPDGGALHAVRLRVVDEDRLLDEETGIIVHVSSPREEILLMPVSTF